MVPIAAFVVGIYATYFSYRKVMAFRAAQYYVDKFSGKLRDENVLQPLLSMLLLLQSPLRAHVSDLTWYATGNRERGAHCPGRYGGWRRQQIQIGSGPITQR